MPTTTAMMTTSAETNVGGLSKIGERYNVHSKKQSASSSSDKNQVTQPMPLH
jgi:hypothetical protein